MKNETQKNSQKHPISHQHFEFPNIKRTAEIFNNV